MEMFEDRIELKIISPIEFNDSVLKLKQMNVIIGENGSGKTLFNKLIWLTSVIKNYYILSHLDKSDNNWKEELNYIIKDTIENLTCEWYENKTDKLFEVFGYRVEIKIENSQLKDIKIDSTIYKEELLSSPIYISSNVRNFNTFKMFNNLKKNILNKKNIESFEDIKKINQFGLKIHDILYLEQISEKMKGVSKIVTLPQVKELLNIDDVYYDEQVSEPVLVKDEKTIPLSMASSGQQSIFMMLLSMI